MKFLNLYRWIIGTKSGFCNSFHDDNLYLQAETYWNKLEGFAFIFIAFFIIMGIGIAYLYYCPFNNKPYRHYHPKYWLIFWLSTFVLVWGATFLAELIAFSPKPDGATTLEIKIALANAIYSSLLYLLVSWIWCQFNWPTNAYRFLKF